ncbi:VPLPA-CTERM-specific exosortase XrtD [Pseudodesulfovibrio piezophilus]|uniref:Eight transmembrane protein EpsH n=1 Tax=Pseudodesulfovibrio piezophilus (strain DSM 21447 / JCM 15486 / C1TLV30) TaxID=1322246 RepID=M1WKS4_PSEP2|nr:VPLPA-CTERM-specific exosortase XrtD [Pseudodesulfovibrio piezophilus]CCH50106.1 Eight transmembrane protein EpsH [Pseudodesulfovibrio piezophilus C1TLV30]
MLTRRNFFYCTASIAWIVVFWSDFPILLHEWNAEDYSHCYLVLPIVGYLLWTERGKRAGKLGGGAFLGLAICLVAVLFFHIGRFASLKFFVHLAMWISLCGIALLYLGDKAIRSLWMPMLVGFFAVPPPVFITRMTSLKLRLISSVLSEKMLQFIGIPVYREGNVIDLGVIQLQVVDACSGLRYLWPSLLMALLVGWFFLSAPRKRLLLLAIAIPVTILSNAFRIALTGVLTKFINPALAEGFFHDFSGWLVYVLSLGLLGACAWLLADRPHHPVRSQENLPPWILPHTQWTGFAACCFLGIMLYSQFHLLPAQRIQARHDFTSFSAQIGPWTGQRIYLSQPVVQSLGADDYVNMVFRNKDTQDAIYVLISWYDQQTTSHAAHAPTSCLVGGGWDIMNKQVLDAGQSDERNFPVTQMTLDKNGQTIISNFWFLQRGRVVVNEWLNKWHLLVDALFRQRTDGALIRLEMPVRPDSSVMETQKTLNSFARQLRGRLTPFLPAGYENPV